MMNFLDEQENGRLEWTRYYDLPEYKIYYRYTPGQPLCGIYLERVIEAPLVNLMAVLAEAQLYKNWVPMTKKSELISKVSHFRQCAEFTYKLPWPFYSRSVFIQACGMQLPDDQACILTMSSAEGDSWLGTPLNRDKSLCYVNVHNTTFYCKHLSENRQLLRCTIHADPHLTWIPPTLINMGLKSCLMVFLDLIQKKSKKLEPAYQDLMLQKRDFYQRCEELMLQPSEQRAPNLIR